MCSETNTPGAKKLKNISPLTKGRLRGVIGFTLVELIVVISILAILGTIAFLSFSGYSSKSRDSVRISDTVNITKGLEIYNVTAGKYPLPDNATTFTGSTGSIINQGTLGDNTSRILKLNKTPLDPSTNSNYIYSVFNDGKYYQLYYEKENITGFNNPNSINTVYADTTTKIPVVKGNYTFDPSLPSLLVVSTSVNTNSGIFDPSVCFIVDGGTNTITSNSGTCLKKSEMSLKDFDSSLVGYWDMETLSGTMLKDLSGNGNDGVFSGTVLPTSTGGLLGKGYNFSGSGYIQINDSQSLNTNNITIFALVEYKNMPFITGNIGIVEKSFTGVIYPYYQYKLGLTPNGHSLYPNGGLSGSFSVNNIYTGRSFKQSNSFLVGEKMLVATSIDGNFIKIYKNGMLVVKNEAYGKLDNYNSKLCFGKSFCSLSNLANEYFNGIIDDIKIYNRALSDSEILQQAKIAGF